MIPRSSWKGFLKLSLVSVPIRAFTANNTSEEVRLNQLHGECNNRIRYQKVCPEHGEVAADQIVSGYEYTKGQYVVIEPDEIQKIRQQADRSVSIHGFVPATDIDPIYYAGRTYYLLPDGVAGSKPYLLMLKGMEEAGVHAIAQVVITGREQLVLLRAHEGMLVMSMLHYKKRVRTADLFSEEMPRENIADEEMSLAKTLIDASRIEDFDLGSLEDRYAENLTKLIKMKVDGQEIVEVPDREEPKIINLMDALKKSVAAAQATSAAGGGDDEGKAERKMAPSGRKTARKKKSG